MADSTASHGLPYPVAADAAVPHIDLRNLAEAVDTELDDIAPGQITGVTAGHLLIADASGNVTGVAMSGDGTISPAGALAIGAGKIGSTQLATKAVTTAKLDDKAVTTAKLGDGAVTRAKVPWIRQAHKTLTLTSGFDTTMTWETAFPSSNYLAFGSVTHIDGNGKGEWSLLLYGWTASKIEMKGVPVSPSFPSTQFLLSVVGIYLG